MKKIIFIVFALIAVPIIFCTAYGAEKIKIQLDYGNSVRYYENEPVYISVNGELLNNLTMPPLIMNGYTLVPAREVFEKLGANVDYKKDLGQVYINYDSKIVVICINSNIAYINGEKHITDTEAKIINNKLMIPVRFVSSALGFDVQWDNTKRTIEINNSYTAIPELVRDWDNNTTKMIDNGGKVLAEYNQIKYIGCNVYMFYNDKNIGILNNKGEIIIKPEYDYNFIEMYAVNDILTLEKGNTFYIFDTFGNLKKEIDNPLGYKLAHPGWNELYQKRYDIECISGSNIVFYEHLGDMVFEYTPEQEWVILRLFSEKKTGEEYYAIRGVMNGEFIACNRSTNENVVLNLDGSYKFTYTLKFLSYLDGGLYYGYKNIPENLSTYGDYLDENIRVSVINEYGEEIADNMDKDSLSVDADNRELTGLQNGKKIKIKY